ncbi:phosphoribosyl transferase [Sistotremastrum suecicum HHB10207 ss-3]|uniref:orotate phosphoribosyltransferase n=1 Tax=Sistotremastrum suecicum HHB10207 ss-3 TaxID=1314776 RepID=A0A166BKF7_9AGAM|nr:phosphoribosyl transferase [Sistotremastrum suecicum HHB10207 ss-3]
MSSTELEPYQKDLIEASLEAGALQFGAFTLKSGRISPYFFNAGLLASGPLLNSLATAYAAIIAREFTTPSSTSSTSSSASPVPQFDILFGPAYKGISLAACTALVLHRDHNIGIGYAYDRKEAKDHGEGGRMVGTPVKGKRVLILDDVMTAGTAVRGSLEMIRKEGGEVVGVVMCLEREEVGPSGASTRVEVEKLIGREKCFASIFKMRDLMGWVEKTGTQEQVRAMKEYWEKYGVKE